MIGFQVYDVMSQLFVIGGLTGRGIVSNENWMRAAPRRVERWREEGRKRGRKGETYEEEG